MIKKDYLEFQCTNIQNDKMFVSIGEYLCFECVEGENRAAITISKSDIEKLLPLILKYYYKSNAK